MTSPFPIPVELIKVNKDHSPKQILGLGKLQQFLILCSVSGLPGEVLRVCGIWLKSAFQEAWYPGSHVERGIRSPLGPSKAHRFLGGGQESRVVQPDLGLGWP